MKSFTALLFCFVLMFLSSFASAQTTSHQQVSALLDLFNSTNGPSWFYKRGWASGSDPCMAPAWFGVTCEARGNDYFVTDINLLQNALSGTLPLSIGTLSHLRVLNLEVNTISGTIPETLGNLSSLVKLEISGNKFTGTLPESFGSLSSLQLLGLNGNQLTGTLPSTLQNLLSLQEMLVGVNFFSGTFPSWIGNLVNLQNLYMDGNNITGTIPDSIQNLSKLLFLDVGTNSLSGTLPDAISKLENLQVLFCFSNNLEGSIPESYGTLSNLLYFDASSNQLSGTIPSSLGNLMSLKVLALVKNQLSGSIPSSFGALSNLMVLDLGSNSLSGTIPSSLGNLSKLVSLLLSSNKLSGSIPDAVLGGNSALSDLLLLELNDNQLSGTLPQQMQLVRYSLKLQDNAFCCPLPHWCENSNVCGATCGNCDIDEYHSTLECAQNVIVRLAAPSFSTKVDPSALFQFSSIEQYLSSSVSPAVLSLADLSSSAIQLTGYMESRSKSACVSSAYLVLDNIFEVLDSRVAKGVSDLRFVWHTQSFASIFPASSKVEFFFFDSEGHQIVINEKSLQFSQASFFWPQAFANQMMTSSEYYDIFMTINDLIVGVQQVYVI